MQNARLTRLYCFDRENNENLIREAGNMARLRHPHLLELIGVCIEKLPFLVVFEVSSYGATGRNDSTLIKCLGAVSSLKPAQ